MGAVAIDGVATTGIGMDHAPTDAPLRGITAIGTSLTHMSYMCLPEQCRDCNGASAANCGSRWTSKLADALGWRVANYGDNGRIARDYLGLNSDVLGWPASELPRRWLAGRGRVVTIEFGPNEPGVRTAEQFAGDVSDLVDVVLGAGAIPILLTLPMVYYDADPAVSWYATDRNPVLEEYSDALRELAIDRDLYVADIYAACEAEILAGRYDHRIRADGVTLDARLDHLYTGAEWASWHTNLHWNDNGAQIVSDTIAQVITENGITEI